jgi:hypothetical protein
VDIIKDLSQKASRVHSLQGLFAPLHPVIETFPQRNGYAATLRAGRQFILMLIKKIDWNGHLAFNSYHSRIPETFERRSLDHETEL